MAQQLEKHEIEQKINFLRKKIDELESEVLDFSSEPDVIENIDFLIICCEHPRGRAFVIEAMGVSLIWKLMRELHESSEKPVLFKNLFKILLGLCKDAEGAEAWGRIGGHKLIQELMDDPDEEIVDSACEVVSLTLNKGISFPMKLLETVETASHSTLMTFEIGATASQNGRSFEILFRSINDRQESMYTVGYKLWSAAIILSNWILKHRDIFEGKSVLELGAGLGLCGLVAGCFANEVIITDFNPVIIENIQRNIELNLLAGFNDNDGPVAINRPGMLQSGFLDWNIFAGDDLSSLDERLQGRKFDIVIASDMVYQKVDAKGVAMATKHFLSDEGAAYFTLPHPKNRYGVQHLGPELEDFGMEQSSYEVSDIDLLLNVEEIKLGFQWNHYIVTHKHDDECKQQLSSELT